MVGKILVEPVLDCQFLDLACHHLAAAAFWPGKGD
jgi:hypothetical protein